MDYEYGEKVEEIESSQKYNEDKGGHFKLFFMIFFVLVVATLGNFYFSTSSASFPKLAYGSYIGELKGITPDNKKFFIESLPTNELFINVLQEDFESQRIPVVLNTDEDGEETIQPIAVKINNAMWKFVGEKNSQGFSGKVLEMRGKRKGQWALISLGESKRAFALEDEQLNSWVKLANQYEVLKQEISLMKVQVASQTKEIEKLTDFMTDGDRLKARAEKKYRDVSLKLDEKSVELKKVESEAQVLENQLAIAQKVTDMGRLVLLARQSLERENRWIDSVLGSELPNQGEDFQQELEQAKKIISVKKAIQEEEEYVAHLKSLMSGTPQADVPNNTFNNSQNSRQPSSFGSLWGDN